MDPLDSDFDVAFFYTYLFVCKVEMKKRSVSGFLTEIIQSTQLTALILLTVNSANSTYSFLLFFPLSIFLYFPFSPLHIDYTPHLSIPHSALRTPHSTLRTPKFQLTTCRINTLIGTGLYTCLISHLPERSKLDTLHKY